MKDLVTDRPILSKNIGGIKATEKHALTLESTLKNRYKDNEGIIQDLCIYSIIK